MDIYDVIDQYIEEGKSGAIATIVAKSGAAPREKGAKMFVGIDEKLYGTVGGGSSEASAFQEALKVAETKKAAFLHIRMDGKKVEDEGMICGGNVDIFIEPIIPEYRELYQEIRRCELKGRKAVLTTRFKGDTFRKTLIDVYGNVWGDNGEEPVIALSQGYIGQKSAFIDNGVIIEPVLTKSNLFIFGAGHVSLFLSKVAKMVDFRVTVIDDRAEFANENRFPDADVVHVKPFESIFDSLDLNGDVYIVIVTRGHRYDADVLEKCLHLETRYIGMIGSKRKVRMIMDHLEKKGFSKDALESVYAPIGIKINSETPEEIAVSIVAELIKVRGES